MAETKIGREGNTLVEGITVQIDAQPYEYITFYKCKLVISGINPPRLSNCDFIDSEFVLAGAALNTIAFLGGLAQSDGGRALVLNMIGLEP